MDDKLEVTVTAAEGYGERQEAGVQEVPRDQFPADVDLQPGMRLDAQDDEGNITPIWIQAVTDSHVTVDFNHPLAGQTLKFAIEVVSLREPSAQELEHGHVHAGGHDH